MTVRARATLSLASACLLWGTAFVFGKEAFRELSVGHTLLYRFALGLCALGVLLGAGKRRPLPRLTTRGWLLLAAGAVLGVPVSYLMQYTGLHRTTVSHASLMLGLAPAVVAGMSALFLDERFDRAAWGIVMTAALGAVLIASSGSAATGHGEATLAGDLLVAASLVASAAWVLIVRVLLTGREGTLSSRDATIFTLVIGFVVLAAWVIAHEGLPPVRLHASTWASVVVLGALCTTAATLLWHAGLEHLPAAHAGVFVGLEPVTGVLLGATLFHDAFGVRAVVGGALILGSVLATSLRRPDA